MKKFFFALFFLPMLCAGLALSGLSLWIAFTTLPGELVWMALGIMAIVLSWFLVRRSSGSGPVSELSLIGRSSASKEGLL